MNIQSIQNLLQHVGIIRKKYDDFAEITGENFNVFDILNVNSSELSHSLFVSYLLDATGKHGQKDLFLKLFIYQLKDRFQTEKNDVLIHFNTEKSQSITEKSIGYKTEDISNGGRIDIIINDGSNNIIIENKIYAGDQEKQLVRYFNHDPKAPLIYLTLGDENPSEDSINHTDKTLEIDKDFISISYKEDIKKWVEECIKAVYDKPLIRETLRQYIYLINELTNQSNNNKMSEEIFEIMKKNFDESFLIHESFEKFKDNLFSDFIEKLASKIEPNKVYIHLNEYKRDRKDSSIIIKRANWQETNFGIDFYFEDKNLQIGIWDKEINYKIKEIVYSELSNNFHISISGKNYPNWYIYGNWQYFKDYKSKDFWINISNDTFVNELSDSLLELVNYCDENIFKRLN